MVKKSVIKVLDDSSRWVNCVKICPNSKFLVAGGDDKKIRIWDLTIMQLISTLDDHDDYIYCIDISRCGKMFATGSRDLTIKLWDL